MQTAEKTITVISDIIKFHPVFSERFWIKVDKNGPVPEHRKELGCCWIWKARRDKDGYGSFHVSENGTQKHIRAHRFSYIANVGDIPPNLHCLHKCDNPACVRPDHLWLGTTQDNTADKMKKDRHRAATGDSNGSRTHPERLPRGEGRWNAKLSAEKVIAIRGLFSGGEKINSIASKFSVGRHAILKVVNGKTWTHIK